MNNIWVVIPAYNEGRTLGDILQRLKAKGLKTFVVNDGSTDDTLAVAEKFSDRVINNSVNLGKGRSLFLAFETLLNEDGWDSIITMDGDRQHCPDDIESFLVLSAENDFIVGNRMHDPIGMPLVRTWTNKIMSWLISRMIRQKVPDTQCGFRLIKRKVLKQLDITTQNYEVETELLIKAAHDGVNIISTDIKCIYHNEGKSNIHPVLDTMRFLKFIFCFKKKG
ncbi:MAG: glycosyltransferase family 2 protein [Candidatus Omnitrophica bacterium]|nr:glycosyltransferase family 2 protein [Candidatus Omnitrophota bacterium]